GQLDAATCHSQTLAATEALRARWKVFRPITPGAAVLQTQIAPAAHEHGRGADDFPLSITSSRVGDGNVLPLARVDRRAPLYGNAGSEGREVIPASVLHDHGILVDVPRRTHLGDVQAGDLVLGGHAVAPDHIDDLEENERGREDPDQVGRHADGLGRELLEPTAIEKAERRLVGNAVPAGAVLPISEQANAEATPRTAGTVDADGTDGVVDLEHPLDEEYAPDHQDARTGPDDHRAGRADEGAGSRDRDQASEQSVATHRRIRLTKYRPHVENRGAAACGRRQHRAGRHARQAPVGAGQGTAGVEAEPAEGQDERTDHSKGDVVAGDGIGGPVLVVLADAGTENDGPGQRRDSARHVHDTGTGEIHVAVAQAEVHAE